MFAMQVENDMGIYSVLWIFTIYFMKAFSIFRENGFNTQNTCEKTGKCVYTATISER